MKRLLLALLLLGGLLPARAATPTFSSFSTNDFTVATNVAPWIIHTSTNHLGTNAYTTLITTNLYVTNLVVGGVQFIISTNAPSVTPTNSNAIYVDYPINQMWVWDPTFSVWIAINPSAASGQYTVPTVNDLRLIHDNGYLQWATTRGNLVATDGQGRSYWWDATASGADDGISVIDLADHLSGEDGRWLEQ